MTPPFPPHQKKRKQTLVTGGNGIRVAAARAGRQRQPAGRAPTTPGPRLPPDRQGSGTKTARTQQRVCRPAILDSRGDRRCIFAGPLHACPARSSSAREARPPGTPRQCTAARHSTGWACPPGALLFGPSCSSIRGKPDAASFSDGPSDAHPSGPTSHARLGPSRRHGGRKVGSRNAKPGPPL